MSEEHGGNEEELFHRQFMAIFEDMSLREKTARVIHGIRQPRDTGDYKFARLQLIRLLAPLSAVVIPCLVIMLLTIFATINTGNDRSIQVNLGKEEEIRQLDDIENLDIPEPVPEENVEYNDDMVVQEVPTPQADFSPKPREYDAVTLTKSPVIMKNIYGNRNPGMRGRAMRTYRAPEGTGDAVLRALRWLKKNQEEDGSWSASGNRPGITGLALMAFLAHGDNPGDEEFGATIRRGIEWLVNNQKPDGRFKGSDGYGYCHPIATYALCEAYGLTRIYALKEVAERSVDPIIKGQHSTGAWDYNYRDKVDGVYRDDISYSGWCAQALKAAYMAGLENDGLKQAIKKAVQGMKLFANKDAGYFGYTTQALYAHKQLTGVGVLCMQLLGAGDEPEVGRGLKWLAKNASFNWNEPISSRPLYHWYYITQAFFHAGGGAWNRWNNKFSKPLISAQIVEKGAGLEGRDIGHWVSQGTAEKQGESYYTSLCALMLQVYYRYLPTYMKVEEIPEESEFIEDGEIEIEIEGLE